MRRILCVGRSFKKRGGGQIKFRDYVMHCLHHPELESHVYFGDGAEYPATDEARTARIWADLPDASIVREVELASYDAAFVSGRSWKLLPKGRKAREGTKLIALVQSLGARDDKSFDFRYLKKPAFRICVSPEIEAAFAHRMVGETVVIPNGVPLDLFRPRQRDGETSVLVWGRKNATLGKRLHEELTEHGLEATLLLDYLPREEFARILGSAGIFVALPQSRESFHLPALEAMASRTAVVCSDAVGNRGFCIPGETCLSPAFDDYADHLSMVERLLTDHDLRERVRERGFHMAQSYSLERERAQFYRFLDEVVFR
jgi:glycosyltransferase involved in cell wall biosynthesis